MGLDLSFPFVDAWWAGRATTPEIIVGDIDRTLEFIKPYATTTESWEVGNPDKDWPDTYDEKLAIVESRVSKTDPDDNGNVEAQPEFGYSVSLFPLGEPSTDRSITTLRFWSGSQAPADGMVYNRVTVNFKKMGNPLTSEPFVKLFGSLSSIWHPDFVSFSSDGTRELVDVSFTSPRPGLMMWFSDRLPCAPGVKSLGYPRLGEGVLVDLRSLVEDSDDPVASLTKVYTQLEGVGAFDPIPPMSPLEH
ncbi:hypothetical protein [Haematomicrobium sanguinis]|uniref:hypothetical protein n=1 Tax=Haematomicrobium sanguinis TaxID=479106 RepID=UPI0004786B91|nr:hypothetical protein [Haematomicrobium sanguinis]